MKILGVVPARYQSSRLPGKPLMDICGKPMIWWVYQAVNKSNRLNEITVATEDVKDADRRRHDENSLFYSYQGKF